jgi:hypothetical protein
LPPVVVMKPVELATVRLAGALAPGVTLSVPPVRFEVRVNVSVVAETVRLTVAGLRSRWSTELFRFPQRWWD